MFRVHVNINGRCSVYLQFLLPCSEIFTISDAVCTLVPDVVEFLVCHFCMKMFLLFNDCIILLPSFGTSCELGYD